MKSFKQHLNEAQFKPDRRKENQMRNFIGDKLENSDVDIDQLKKEFKKKFGQGYDKAFDKILDELLYGEETIVENPVKRQEKKMVDFIGDKIENSDMDIDQLRKAFEKKFGKGYKSAFDRIVSMFVD